MIAKGTIYICKSGCDSNDCELQIEQATPPILAGEVWPVGLQKGEIIKISRNACVKKFLRQWLVHML